MIGRLFEGAQIRSMAGRIESERAAVKRAKKR
jgi:hypothetical protein